MFENIFRSRFGTVYLFGMIFILIAFIIRTMLLLKTWSGLDPSLGNFFSIYLVGAFFDGVAASYFVITLVLYLILLPDKLFNHPWHRIFFSGVFFLFLYGLVFGIVSEWIFWDEFGVRFNFIAVDYLVYTKEVVTNIWQSYPVPILLTAILIVTVAIFRHILKKGYLTNSFAAGSTLKERSKHGAVLLALPIICFLAVNDSYSEISNNRFHNELAKNGVHALFAAFRNNKLEYGDFYLQKDETAILTRLRELLKTDNSEFVSDDLYDITRKVTNNGPEKRHNVMFITVESLSGEYLSKLGGTMGLTPYMDKLTDESLFFSNIYATGTRTVRGMESLVLAIPPSPGRSMVKRVNNENLFSSGFVFKKRGYDTKFIYGGYGYFDNMNYFYGNNGFDIVDRTDIDDGEVTHENVWGVADEDIYRRATEEADKTHAAGKPFFHFIMTTSNHRPYTYPDGRIDIPSPGGWEGGVKYSDFAINKFLQDTKSKPWYDNTLFVIIADHCAGSSGRTELPLFRYRIPFLIYQPALIKPMINDRLVSQVDVMPTILGLLNWSYTSRFYGQDILKMDDDDERSLVGNYQKLGLIRGNRLALLTPQNGSNFYQFDRHSKEQLLSDPIPDMLFDAISYYQGASLIAKAGNNRWIDENP